MTTEASQGGAALSAEERAELRALCDLFARYEASDGRMWREEVEDAYEAAATALPRLLDALERSERERGALEQGFLIRANEDWDSVMEYCCQKQKAALRVALHDAITRPMGVVPASAEPFYSPDMADVRRAATASNAAPPEQGHPSGEAA